MIPSLPPLCLDQWELTHMVLLILQDGSIEGSLLPLLWGQSNLTAEPEDAMDFLSFLLGKSGLKPM